MKRCPTCHKVYADDAQTFCLDDGALLVSATAGSFGPEMPTQNLPSDRSASQTEVLPSVPPAGYHSGLPPPPYAPPLAQKRSPLPWILVGALVLIGVVVTVILATRNANETMVSSRPGATPTVAPTGKSSPSNTTANVIYNSDDGRFSITLPPGFSAFTAAQRTQSTASGDIELHILQSQNNRGSCLLGYSDFPAVTFVGRTPQKILEDGRDGALRNVNATLEKEESRTVQGRPGLEFYGSTTSSGTSIYVRFLFVFDKPRVYQIGYLAFDRADLDTPAVQAYFDSFRLK